MERGSLAVCSDLFAKYVADYLTCIWPNLPAAFNTVQTLSVAEGPDPSIDLDDFTCVA